MESEKMLESERAFFDQEAQQLADAELIIPADQIERYRRAKPSPWNHPKDELFARIMPLEGKSVLDYGCGHGENSCLLAACGARVTASDLSPMSIEKARQRAKLHGVDHLIQFDVRQAGQTGYPPGSFDLVVGVAILHHLHTQLDAIFAETAAVLKPGGEAYFIEPMANSRLFRFLRRLTPLKAYATEDERQLVDRDLDPLRRHFPEVEVVWFHNLGRLNRVFGRWGVNTLAWVDRKAQRVLPFIRRFYGRALIIARSRDGQLESFR